MFNYWGTVPLESSSIFKLFDNLYLDVDAHAIREIQAKWFEVMMVVENKECEALVLVRHPSINDTFVCLSLISYVHHYRG